MTTWYNHSVHKELDQFAINIEFLLISVIQGAALAAVAIGASEMVARGSYPLLLYAFSALLVILIFWSQAIMHTLGFIRWPLDMFHNFLYFLVSLIEIMAFAVMDDPFRWFIFAAIIGAVSGTLYYYDLKMIHRARPLFSRSKEGKLLYQDLCGEQKRDLTIFVPLGVLCNGISAYAIYKYPHLFIDNNFHLILVGTQIVFALIVLHDTLSSFRRRSLLIKKL